MRSGPIAGIQFFIGRPVARELFLTGLAVSLLKTPSLQEWRFASHSSDCPDLITTWRAF